MEKINRKIFPLWISLGILSAVLFPIASRGNDSYLNEYLSHKALCNYERALNVLEEWTLESKDADTIETNLFRIDELLEYPELDERALKIFERISLSEAVTKHPFLAARIKFFKRRLLLKKGAAGEWFNKDDPAGFVRKYKLIGPFGYSGPNNFDIELPPEKEMSMDAECRGKVSLVRWFQVSADLEGTINIADLFADVGDSLYFFLADVAAPSEGNYVLSLGKTGFTDLWLDGEKIFTSRRSHDFLHDQYRIRVFLPRGRHRILIKTGDSVDAGVKVSLRFTDEKGNPVPAEHADSVEPAAAGSLNGVSYFASLENALKNARDSGYDRFRAAYLFYIAGLNSREKQEALSLFTGAGEDDLPASASDYYMGIIERDSVKRDFYLRESLKRNNKNIEARKELIDIKLENNFFYEAEPLVESIKNIKPVSCEYLVLKAKLFLSRGWHEEAVKTALCIKKSHYPSAACAILARIHRLNKRYDEARDNYLYLYRMDRYNLEVMEDLISCYEKTGEYREIERILLGASLFFPNSVRVRLKLAEIKSKTESHISALPYLSSAKRLSPFNKDVLLDTGLVYHRLGRNSLALYYMRMALGYDPDNFQLKRYLRVITGEENELADFLIKDGPQKLALSAADYINEPAVVLLNEAAYRVMADGSFEKRVHRAVLINEQNAAKEFTTQYVVINPDTDTVEDFKCAVINNGNKIEVSDVTRRSLSDPESRLYYDLQAYIITLPGVNRGSIIEVQYTVKSRGGALYKNYFGEKLVLGEEYRTLITNYLISFPEEKKIYCHLEDIKSKSPAKFKIRNRQVYRLIVENISPYKAELAMPHYSEVLPCLYFTSHRDWGDLYSWYADLVKDRIKMSPEMKEVLNRLINDGDTELERVKKIYDHVNSSIRYVGFEFGVGGIQPRRSDLTYHTKMGDCKDISLVLAAMLKEAGIDARLALLRVSDSGRANLNVPFLGEFNHAITYVNLKDGFFIDGTAKMGGYRELPAQDSGVTAMVIGDEGYSFINTESGIYLKNIESAETDVAINEDGRASLSRTITRQGSFSAATRSISMNRNAWKGRIKEYWNRLFAGARIDNLKIINMELNEPVSYNYKIEIPSFINTEREEIILRSFMSPSNYYKNYAMLKNRTFPVSLSQKWTAKVNIRYHLPGGYEIFRMPEDEKYEHEKFSAVFRFSQGTQGKYIDVESVISFKDYRIEVNEYNEFRSFTRFIDRKENGRIILLKRSKRVDD